MFRVGPTPLQPADRLGAALGLAPGHLFVKRDDLTPLAGGGNKVRKLEYLCAAAVDAGADILVTGGGAQSNHVRATAVADPAEARALLEWGERTGVNVMMLACFGREPSGKGGMTDRRALFQVVGDAALSKAAPLPLIRWRRRVLTRW